MVAADPPRTAPTRHGGPDGGSIDQPSSDDAVDGPRIALDLQVAVRASARVR